MSGSEFDHSKRFADLPAPAVYGEAQKPRPLADGLVLRHASDADRDALAAFNCMTMADPPDFTGDTYCAAWTQDLMSAHPRAKPEDFLLVEDPKARRIVSSLCLLPHRFRYDEVEMAAGQVELVGTHPEYRRRGLVRALMDAVHERGDARGERLQVIDGIPWYYRQFGYEMALENGGGYLQGTDALRPAECPEGLRVRPAVAEDAALVANAYQVTSRRSRLSCVHDEPQCHYEIAERRDDSLRTRIYKVVETSAGEPLAVFAHYPLLWERKLLVTHLELLPPHGWHRVLPAILAELFAVGSHFATQEKGDFDGTILRLGSDHPVYRALGQQLGEHRMVYAYYVRIADLAGFVREIAPALERRIAQSDLCGASRELALNFYRSGLRLRFEKGSLAAVEAWKPSTEARGCAAYPELSFLQLLLGFRSHGALEAFLPDCCTWDEASRPWLEALFPEQASLLVLAD